MGLFRRYSFAKGVTPSGFDKIIAGMQNSFSTGSLIEEINSDQIKYEDKFLQLIEELTREGVRYINRFVRYNKLFSSLNENGLHGFLMNLHKRE